MTYVLRRIDYGTAASVDADDVVCDDARVCWKHATRRVRRTCSSRTSITISRTTPATRRSSVVVTTTSSNYGSCGAPRVTRGSKNKSTTWWISQGIRPRRTSRYVSSYYYFLPRYSVPEDLEITNKEKKNYNGCNGLAGSERVLKWDRVPPYYYYYYYYYYNDDDDDDEYDNVRNDYDGSEMKVFARHTVTHGVVTLNRHWDVLVQERRFSRIPCAEIILLPISVIKRWASSANGPRDSTATGIKIWLDDKPLYLADLLSAAISAAFPA